MKGHKMFKHCFLIFLSLALSNLSEARQVKKHPSAVLVGSVYCDTCAKASHFISGSVVAVECSGTKTSPKFTKEFSTNEHGEFEVRLPFSVSKHVKKINRCSVKLIKSSEPSCAVASTSTSSNLHSKSRKQGKHIFSAGLLTFKPLKQPELCDQKPSVQESNAFESQKSISNPNDLSYLPPIGTPPTSNLPPVAKDLPLLPQLPNLPPLPQLPPLPPLPGLPLLPPWPKHPSTTNDNTKEAEVSSQKVAQTQFFGPNNPFRPPSLFPPIVPSPPSSTIPPIIPSPPTSTFPPIIPPPSTFPPGNFPTPPVSAFPLPPFRPLPGFPGAPPAMKSIFSKNSSP